MNEEQAAQLLLQAYNEASEDKKQVASIHLFGIRFADELQNLSLSAIVERANLPKSYVTEIRKGINLSEFVTVRD